MKDKQNVLKSQWKQLKTLAIVLGISSLFILYSCSTNTSNNTIVTPVHATNQTLEIDTMEKVVKSEKEWKSQLTDFEYHVLREKGTERAFSGDWVDNKSKGVYTCKGCDLELFDSSSKFRSGTGWPSFYEPVIKANVKDNVDKSHGMVRTEVVCNRCEGHLGHVFNDGPAPTGLRYCINSISLNFKEEK